MFKNLELDVDKINEETQLNLYQFANKNRDSTQEQLSISKIFLKNKNEIGAKSGSYSMGRKTTPSHSQTQRKSVEKWVCLDNEMIDKKNFDQTKGVMKDKESRRQTKEVYLAHKVLNSDRRGKNLSESTFFS